MENFDALDALKSYIRFPSVSTDSNYIVSMSHARDFVCSLLRKIGFKITIVETDCHPIIYAERFTGPDNPHVVLYGHYDVQPADPLDLWDSEAFEPVIKDNKIYGRGAADNKGPTIVHIAALINVLNKNPNLPINISYVIEGEEEMGSPSMSKFFDQYGTKLSKADFMIVSDTGSPSRNQLVITTGLRGLVEMEIEIVGPKLDLHSGIHGGPIVNPLHVLSKILSSLHKIDGSVDIPGFYDDISPIQEWERKELKKYPFDINKYMGTLCINHLNKPRGTPPFEAFRFEPTLEINGLGGGYQGEGTKTIIPSRAFAKITCRLVSGQDGQKIQELIVKKIKKESLPGVQLNIRKGCHANAYTIIPPHKANLNSFDKILDNCFKSSELAIKKYFGNEPLYVKEGGSIPVIADFKHRAGLDSIMIGLFTPEDNLHAPNESFDLELMDKAIKVFQDIFTDLSKN